MEIGAWLASNAFKLLSAIGIVAGLCYTARSFNAGARTRRVSNLIELTTNHREIWTAYLFATGLERVLDAAPDLSSRPPSLREQVFVNLLIGQLNAVYHAMRYDMVIQPEGFEREARQLLSLPIPASVWDDSKTAHNGDFVAVVERCRKQ